MFFQKYINFELEICVKERGGRAARCMGSVVVAEIIAREARRSRARVRAWGGLMRVQRPPSMPFPGPESRESCGTWQLPQTTTTYYYDDDYCYYY